MQIVLDVIFLKHRVFSGEESFCNVCHGCANLTMRNYYGSLGNGYNLSNSQTVLNTNFTTKRKNLHNEKSDRLIL